MTKYDIIIIGAGAGGLNIASFMNKIGLSVLLIDKTDKNIGGDCLNFGCIPSKALIHVSRLVADAKASEEFGLSFKDKVDMKKVKKYIFDRKEIIRKHENAEHFRNKGMNVVLGTAKFSSENSVIVNGGKYFGKKIIIATGAIPRKLNIPGIEKVKQYNNENIFDIEKLPRRLLIIGGGPIGIEIGQALQRLGSKVSVIQRGPVFLPKENPEISGVLLKQLEKEGMKFYFNSSPKEFTTSDEIIISDVTNSKKEKRINFDAVFVAIGKKLNINNLDLEKAKVKMKNGKIVLDNYLKTTNKNILVCGDAVGDYQFTHAAELHAQVILNNFFSPFKKKLSYDNLSWVTYTSPEIATFGLNEKELIKRNIKFDKLSLNFTDDDRSIVDNFQDGKMIIYITKNSKKILLGGSMVALHAGEMFQELVLAKSLNLSIKDLFNKIYPYPTASRVNKKIIADNLSLKLSDFSKKILKFMY